MIYKDLVFDKKKDISEVDQFGYIDLSQALSTGTVDSSLKIDEKTFNNIDDPGSILGKPEDAFQAMHMASIVNERGRVEKKDD